MDSQSVLIATGAATAFAAVASFGFSLLWRRLDRPEADWLAFDGTSTWGMDVYSAAVTGPSAKCTVANIGDGAAFNPDVVGFGCRASIGSRGAVPSIRPGEDVALYVGCDPAVWDDAFVVVIWTASPTRRKYWSRRIYVLPLRRVAEPPRYRVRNELDPTTVRYLVEEPAPPEGWRADLPAPQEPPRRRLPRWWGRRQIRNRLHAAR